MAIASNGASSYDADNDEEAHLLLNQSPEEIPEEVSKDTDPPSLQNLPDDENLNKIRDILFGQQVKAHDLRFETLEQRLSKDYDHLRADFIQRIEALENRLMSHLDSLTQRIREEETGRDKSIAKLSQTLDEAARSAELKTTQLDERLSGATQELQAEIKHQTLTLKDTLERQIYDVVTELDTEKKERKRSTHAERTKLSTLLADLSQQLSDDQ